MTSRAWIAAGLFCSLVLALNAVAAARARAQENESEEAQDPNTATERARLHFRNGVDFYRERNYRAALIEFKRAYKASPHYKLLYNLGQASLELQEDASAIEYFTNYLREGADELGAERKKEVEQDIIRLQARLCHVTITVNQPGAEIYIDDGLIGTSPLPEPVKLSVGRRRIVALKSGFITAERTLDVAAGDHLSVELELKDRSQDLAKLQLVASAAAARHSDSSLSAAAWSGIATAVVGAGAVTMSVLTALAQSNYDTESKQKTSAARLQDIRDDAKAKALAADIAWGATIVGAGITTVLLIANSGSDEAPSQNKQGIKVDLGAGSLHLRGSF